MDGSRETILQFGAGNFLRAFVDLFVHEANERGEGVGRIVVVQSTRGSRAELLNARNGSYHVVTRGIEEGRQIDLVTRVGSISRALVAATQWDEVLEVARSPQLRTVISNTTERGYELSEADGDPGRPVEGAPGSFPARLLACLAERFRAGGEPVSILPCELLDDNADRLREIVLGLARDARLGDDIIEWVGDSCRWHKNLVDRIVTGRPEEHPLLESDPLLTACEPYALFAIEASDAEVELGDHPAIVRTADVKPYGLRKVRILNGAHTALVCRALPAGFRTVREAVEDEEISAWLRELMFEEIVPTIEGRADGAEDFANAVLERFLNPFIDHELEKIALYHDEKVRTRLEPTLREFRQSFGREPRLLSELVPGVPQARETE